MPRRPALSLKDKGVWLQISLGGGSYCNISIGARVK
jgi:hypothetical protein